VESSGDSERKIDMGCANARLTLAMVSSLNVWGWEKELGGRAMITAGLPPKDVRVNAFMMT